jgi:cephalosporin hydroxylase
MIYIDKITKKSNLEENESISTYNEKWSAQQNYKAFETFFYFLKEVRPKKILEIGTSIGGFISFVNDSCKVLNLDCEVLSLDINTYPWYDDMREEGIDLRVENVFSENYEDVSDYVKEFISSEGTTMVLCDGGDKKREFNILSNYLKVGDFILGHDYAYDENYFEENVNQKIWNWLELTEKDIEDACKRNNLIDYRRDVFQSVVWVCKMKSDSVVEINNETTVSNNIVEEYDGTTLVTGLWNIKRDSLTEGWSRSYEHYLTKFKELLKIKNNLIIFGDEELEPFVWENRDKSNTQFVKRDLEWFKSTVPFEKIQEIRQSPEWYGQSGWLVDSTQAKLEWYNPLVMSKMFLLNDARIVDRFDSKELFWIDAGITNTIHPGYFTHDKIQNKLHKIFNKFGFICFPYEASTEIHGFTYPKINSYAGQNVKLVCRGGLFGGPKDTISNISGIYYNTLTQTLNDGYMGTEESVFSIMLYKHPDLIDYVQIEDNGLLGKFCEDVKNDAYEVKNVSGKINQNSKLDLSKVSLYVIGFNSPNQFQTLIDSMIEYDKDFIEKPKKFLLDNSTDLTTTPEFIRICETYGFEHIKKDNLGICGGRQWIAEHFEESENDFMFFFEDDMFFYPKKGDVCKNGFNRYVDNLYIKSLEIIKNENLDFLKLNYTEFFGDNGTQWSWYNVPQAFRETNWPEKSQLPVMGLDPNAPKTKFEKIVSYKGIPYATGEVYYCNWPQIVTKYGNKKMFLTTTWAHPFEQTWMSYMYQETIKKEISTGLLLLTPTEHNRFEHYDGKLRKES